MTGKQSDFEELGHIRVQRIDTTNGARSKNVENVNVMLAIGTSAKVESVEQTQESNYIISRR